MRVPQSYGYGFTITERQLSDQHWRILVRDAVDGAVVEKADHLGPGADMRSGQHFQHLKEKYLALY